MPSVAERVRQVQLKVERAKKHIEDVQAEITRFLDTKPYGIGTKRDPQSGKLIYYVTSVRETPPCLPLIAGDAIQCLMSALDHLAYQIVCSDTGDRPPHPDRIYFPIRASAEKYEAVKRGKMTGAVDATFEAIDALKPYKGGNAVLWALFQLNNIEKHRTLLTVGSCASGINIATYGVDRMAHFFAQGDTQMAASIANNLRRFTLWLGFKDNGFPLKEGYELFIGTREDEPDANVQFAFNVALAEPGVFESQSLVESLHQFATLVEGIVMALTPRLRDSE
ncbi:MAG: hypothetical protein JSR67_12250 [Proteobacteria bacterium]|nr:hypothetical protein [Pseudomonadota bacterium]